MGKAAACCGPSKLLSISAVRSGMVPPVEITCCRTVLAEADVAAVKTASAQPAETANQRTHKETLTRTGDDGSPVAGVGQAVPGSLARDEQPRRGAAGAAPLDDATIVESNIAEPMRLEQSS